MRRPPSPTLFPYTTLFRSVIADPNIAYILLMLGFYGLLFELQNPGAILPGVVGGISLILAFLALRSEEHTSELQSQFHLVCRLLLEKKNWERPTRTGYAWS